MDGRVKAHKERDAWPRAKDGGEGGGERAELTVSWASFGKPGEKREATAAVPEVGWKAGRRGRSRGASRVGRNATRCSACRQLLVGFEVSSAKLGLALLSFNFKQILTTT